MAHLDLVLDGRGGLLGNGVGGEGLVLLVTLLVPLCDQRQEVLVVIRLVVDWLLLLLHITTPILITTPHSSFLLVNNTRVDKVNLLLQRHPLTLNLSYLLLSPSVDLIVIVQDAATDGHAVTMLYYYLVEVLLETGDFCCVHGFWQRDVGGGLLE